MADHQVSADLSGDASLNGALNQDFVVASSLSGDAALSAADSTTVPVASSLSGDAALSAMLSGELPVASSLSGDAALSAILNQDFIVASSLSGDTVLSAILFGELPVASSLSGDVALSAILSGGLPVASSLSGDAALSAALNQDFVVSSSLSGDAALSAMLSGELPVASSLSGDASLSGFAISPRYSIESISFDGVDDHVAMGDVLGFERTDAFSVSLWTKSVQTGVEANFFSKCGDGPNYRGYLLNQDDIDDSLVFYLINVWPTNCIEVRPTQTVNDGQWHHAVVTYNGSSQASGITFYIDGVAVPFTTLKNTLSATILTPTPLQLGRRTSSGLLQPYTGNLDEVSFWDKALSESDIAGIYNDGCPTDLAQHSSVTNLVGWWRMGEGSAFPVIPDLGTGGVPYPLVQDLSGNGYDGTMMNMEVTDVTSDAPYGKCVAFDGVDEYVGLLSARPILDTPQPFSLSAWVYITSTSTIYRTIMGTCGSGAPYGITFGYTVIDTTSDFTIWAHFIYDNATNAIKVGSTTPRLPANSWVFVTLTWDGNASPGATGLKLYGNGSPLATATSQDNLGTNSLVNSAYPFSIGSRSPASDPLYFRGKIDNAAVWNKELSAAEVAELYNDGHLHPATEVSFVGNLIAYWPMGEGDTFPTLQDRRFGSEVSATYPTILDAKSSETLAAYPTILDASGSGFNGTMTNMAINDIVLDSPGGTFSKFALDFDGSDDYVACGNVLGFERTDAFSVEFTFKAGASVDNEFVIAKAIAGTPEGWHIILSSTGQIILGMVRTWLTNAIVVETVLGYRDNVWHQAVMTYDGSSSATGVAFYIDGAAVVSSTFTDTLSASIVSAAELRIGTRQLGYPNECYSGRLEEVAVWDKKLFAAEVLEVYNGGVPTDNRLLSSADNLVGYWRMGDQVRFDGTMTNMAVNDIVLNSPGGTFSKFSTDFDGSDDYVTMGTVLQFERTDTYSLSIWCKTRSIGSEQKLISAQNSGGWRGYSLAVFPDGRIHTGICNTWNSNVIYLYTTNATLVNDGNWHHISITYDGSSVAAGFKIYLDGTSLPTTVQYNSLSATTVDLTAPFALGYAIGYGQAYNGNIGDCGVYNKELSAADVTTIHNGGVPTDNRLLSSATNLVGYWRMGDQVRFDGTLTNMEAEDIEDRAVNSALAFSKKSLAFGGTNEYVTMGNVLGYEYTDAFSYSFWVKTSGSTGGYLVSKMEDAPNYRGYGANRLAGGTLRLHFISIDASNKLTVDTTTTIHDGKWHHVVVTYDGSATPSGVVCYIDTVPSGLTIVQDNLSGTMLTSASFNIVGRGDGTWGLTIATVDEVSVWGKELSVVEVVDIYNTGVPKDLSSYADLDGYWRLGDSVPNDGLMVNMEAEDIVLDASWSWLIDASLSGDAVLSATLSGELPVASSLSGNAALNAILNQDFIVASNLSGDASLVPDLTCSMLVESDLSGDAEIGAGLSVELFAQSDLSGDAALNSALNQDFVVSSSLSGDAVLSAILNQDFVVASSLSGDAAVNATLSWVLYVASSLSGDAVLSAEVDTNVSVASSLSGDAYLSGALNQDFVVASSLSGDSALNAADSTTVPINSSLSGDAALNAELSGELLVASSLSGDAALNAILIAIYGTSSSLSGDASLVATSTATCPVSSNLSGHSSLSAMVVEDISQQASLSGSASLQAFLSSDVNVHANMSGQADMLATLSFFVMREKRSHAIHLSRLSHLKP
jgi:hypothetical protein